MPHDDRMSAEIEILPVVGAGDGGTGGDGAGGPAGGGDTAVSGGGVAPPQAATNSSGRPAAMSFPIRLHAVAIDFMRETSFGSFAWNESKKGAVSKNQPWRAETSSGRAPHRVAAPLTARRVATRALA